MPRPTTNRRRGREALHYIDGAVRGGRADPARKPDGRPPRLHCPPSATSARPRDLLEGRRFARTEIISIVWPVDQRRAAARVRPTQERKIVIATNIAENPRSTIPGNPLFVVDTGAARISRYSPQARTRRLPIEPVAQSSADQRKAAVVEWPRVSASGSIREGLPRSGRDSRSRDPARQSGRCHPAHEGLWLWRDRAISLHQRSAGQGVQPGYQLLEELGAIAPAGEAGAEADPGPTAHADRTRTRPAAGRPHGGPHDPAGANRKMPAGGAGDRRRSQHPGSARAARWTSRPRRTRHTGALRAPIPISSRCSTSGKHSTTTSRLLFPGPAAPLLP